MLVPHPVRFGCGKSCGNRRLAVVYRMTPSIFQQPGSRGDREVVVPAKLEAGPLSGQTYKKAPDNANTKISGSGGAYGTGASGAHKTSNNFFAGIAQLFAGLCGRKTRVPDNSGSNSDTTTTCSTPVVGSAHEDHGGTSTTTKVTDTDGLVLPGCRHNNSSEPVVVAMALRSPGRGTLRSPVSQPVEIQGASRVGGPWQATTAANTASAESESWRFKGRGADGHEELGGGMEGVTESLRGEQEGNGGIDARQRLCDQDRRVSFVVSFSFPAGQAGSLLDHMSGRWNKEMRRGGGRGVIDRHGMLVRFCYCGSAHCCFRDGHSRAIILWRG